MFPSLGRLREATGLSSESLDGAFGSDASHPAGRLVALSAVVGATSEDSGSARETVQLRPQADRDRIIACIRAGIADKSLRGGLMET